MMLPPVLHRGRPPGRPTAPQAAPQAAPQSQGPAAPATPAGGAAGSARQRSVRSSGTPSAKGRPPTTVRVSWGRAPATTTWCPREVNAANSGPMLPRQRESIFLNRTLAASALGLPKTAAEAAAAVSGVRAREWVSTTRTSAALPVFASADSRRRVSSPWVAKHCPTSAAPEKSSAWMRIAATSPPFVGSSVAPSWHDCANRARSVAHFAQWWQSDACNTAQAIRPPAVPF